jgi:hypothetical protein
MDNPKNSTPQVVEEVLFNPSRSYPPSTTANRRSSFQTHGYITGFLLIGVAFALTHHFYYASLEGDSIDGTPQEWAVRVGTGLAFLSKACLIASATLSYQQHYWSTLRSRSISVSGIDDIMGLLAEPRGFFNWEILRNAWSSVLIALAIWYCPFAL